MRVICRGASPSSVHPNASTVRIDLGDRISMLTSQSLARRPKATVNVPPAFVVTSPVMVVRVVMLMSFPATQLT
jgi:hypothetical protein